MKATLVNYDEATGSIQRQSASTAEEWLEVCARYHDDVHRLRSVSDQGEYTALFECFDDEDYKFYYLVEADVELKRHQRKTFHSKLGREGS